MTKPIILVCIASLMAGLTGCKTPTFDTSVIPHAEKYSVTVATISFAKGSSSELPDIKVFNRQDEVEVPDAEILKFPTLYMMIGETKEHQEGEEMLYSPNTPEKDRESAPREFVGQQIKASLKADENNNPVLSLSLTSKTLVRYDELKMGDQIRQFPVFSTIGLNTSVYPHYGYWVSRGEIGSNATHKGLMVLVRIDKPSPHHLEAVK